MKIKLTNQQMYDSVMAFMKLEEKGKLGYAIMKNMKKLITEVESFDSYRDELLKKYAKPNEDGSEYIFNSSKEKDEFLSEIESVANESYELDLATVSEEVFTSGNLTNQQMYVLDWMVTEDTPEGGS